MKLSRRSFLGLAGTGILAASMPRSVFATIEGGTLPDYSFIQLTDTHVPDESGIERTTKVVEAINSFLLPYDSIIHTGDVSHGYGQSEEMKQAHNVLTFNKQTYFVPGNTDVTFHDPGEYEPAFEKEFNKCNWSFSPVPGLRLALFNSQPLSGRAGNAAREKAFERLKKMLSPSMPTILFCHATGMPDFYENEMHDGWKQETLNRWADLMKQGGVFAVMAGHFHRDEMHMMGDIPVHLCAPVVGWWGRQTTFRHWTLKDGSLTYRTIYV